MTTNENEEKLKEDYDDIKYEKPDTHKNFWKSFGLDSKAGKLLYYLYGDNNKINPNLIAPKKFVKKEKDVKEIKIEKSFRNPQINYPSYKKKIEKENPIDKIPHKKPLSKILEETKNYESIKELPIKIGRNREEEKKKLNVIFLEQKCKVLPPSCAPLVLTEEEKKEIIKNAEKRYLDLSESNSREDKIIDALKNYRTELKVELNKKINEFKNIMCDNNTSNNKPGENTRRLNELEYQKINLKNEIEQCKKNIKKTDDILNSLK
ncbi:conserved Plasmodium protein, unknown function [Plasmodium gallinaceum]|uniref:Enkurin domain-containing protein n=1 Tax=Plasmodium gallinaceum TaxID=5849 RepID=A0A1J1GR77_PLAGA|nr:conserved Plasmodium protein, unknown function [Plasmodium gallinaceum]CRG95017.1 conserved Plasmodium protein, unknown function [Plasmodium gallinaceum]